jgi:hypothetical protein
LLLLSPPVDDPDPLSPEEVDAYTVVIAVVPQSIINITNATKQNVKLTENLL